jgi:hypothetical protein
LLALRNTARYYSNGKIEEIPGTELMEMAKPYFIYLALPLWHMPTETPRHSESDIISPKLKPSFAELSATKASPNLSVFSSTLASLVKK